METKEKFEAEIDKAKARDDAAYKKIEADLEPNDVKRDLKKRAAEIEKDFKVAGSEVKEDLN